MRFTVRLCFAGIDIVVGTPGRTIDLLKGGSLDLSDVRHVVLDEADEMLNMGFKVLWLVAMLVALGAVA